MPRRKLVAPVVYLSGPMAGLTQDQAQNWRSQVKHRLEPYIECLDPMRGIVIPKGKTLKPHYGQSTAKLDKRVDGSKYALTRDFLDTKRSDLILVNLLEADKISIGTVMEIAWAYALQIPIVVALPLDNNVHNHCLINSSISVVVHSLNDLVEAALDLLNIEKEDV